MRGSCFFKSAGIGARLLFAIVALLFLTIHHGNSVLAQKQKPASSQLEKKLDEQSQQKPDDVVRIRTDLVQTSVSVLDKRGKFVDNLRMEDFELRIDGKPYPVLFFDRVINGVAGESLKAPAPRNTAGLPITPRTDTIRTVLFFIDDLHLSAESVTRTRKMLSNYIEQQMGANDEAVVASASGQIGFLQQLTGEREVLRAAIERLKYRPLNLLDTESPRMSAYQAHLIEQDDEETLTYFEGVLLNGDLKPIIRSIGLKGAQEIANRRVKSRASRIVRQSSWGATQTLAALNNAVRSSAQIPGRKLIVFVSDGFLINDRNSSVTNELQRITDAAVKVGAVLYTIQASGLNTSFPDASSDVTSIAEVGTGRVYGEDVRMQDPLTQLAADSGGKALFNANDLNGAVKRVLQESNDYYLLAWRPETEGFQGKEFHRIEVSVKGHPDLSVLLQGGFFGEDKTPAVSPASAVRPKTSEGFPLEELAAVIKGQLNSGALATYLTANYLDVPNRGARLSILLRVENVNVDSQTTGKPATVDVAGVIYNDSGKLTASFVDTLKPETNAREAQHTTYLNQIDVKPGLYQVRVAARDSNGLMGVTSQWVKVPDLTSHHLSLSSLLIGERDIVDGATATDTVQFQKAQLKIDKRFVQGSRLRFLTYVYNAARGSASQSSQLEVRVELFHDNRAVVSMPPLAIETKGVDDPARIPYAGEFNLTSLPKGRYLLRVTVTDRSAKTNASQEAAFAIE